jgi:hypothetical protein
MAAGAGSTGGILAVYIGKMHESFKRKVSVCFKNEGEIKWQPAAKKKWSNGKRNPQ